MEELHHEHVLPGADGAVVVYGCGFDKGVVRRPITRPRRRFFERATPPTHTYPPSNKTQRSAAHRGTTTAWP